MWMNKEFSMTDPTALVFAVDGGASKTDATLFDGAGIALATVREGPCNLYQESAVGIAAIRAAWAGCCAAAGLEPVAAAARTTISAGLAGISGPGTQAMFHAAFGAFKHCLLSSDGYAGLVGAFAGGPGGLVSVGTGVVGCRFDAAGFYAQLGGWGFPVGDQGGGAWLGLHLASAWLAHRDGMVMHPGSVGLWRELEAVLGADRGTILGRLRKAPPATYATLAPLAIAADLAGDAFARELLDAAARHLANLAQALGETRVALGGGLAGSLAPRVARALAGSGVAIDLAARADPIRGALRIAQGVRPAEFIGGDLDAAVPPLA